MHAQLRLTPVCMLTAVLCGACCAARLALVAQGPAVWALRAQTDKLEYSREMRRLVENTPNLYIREVRRFFGLYSMACGTRPVARCLWHVARGLR